MNGLRVLLRKNLRAMMNLRRIAQEQSLFKVSFTLVFASLMLFGLWAMFLEGFTFLDTLGGVGLVIIPRLFGLFFFGLAMLLVLSSIVTSYTSFFRSDELPYLLLRPLTIQEIVFYKYLESTVYSSWAFFFIIVPFVGAYATHEKLSLLFSVWTLLFSIPFVLLCSAIGSVACMVMIRWLPRARTWVVTGLVLAVLAGYAAWRTIGPELQPGAETTLVLNRLVPGLRLASNPLWPSWWVAEGIMAFSRGRCVRGVMLLGVLISHLLVFLLVVDAVGRRLFYEGWQRVLHATSGGTRRGVLLRPMEKALRFLAPDVRAVVIKDMRLFFREPAQWVQGFFFFGLLGIYFLNLRNLHYHTLPIQWRNLIAFLNVFSVSAVLASLGCRFVYPQLSFEGHSFWILGLSPSSMGRILMAKFGLSLAVMLMVSFGLMTICVHMLKVDALTHWISLGISIAISFAIAGLSIGLGAIFRDLKQRNPSAIVSSFGGTLNLVLSLGFIIATMFPFGFVLHMHRMGHLGVNGLYRGVALGAVWMVFVTVVTTVVPLVLGRQSLVRGEY